MRYVLDSSVGLKWLLSESDSDKALRVRDAYLRRIDDLLAPAVFAVEVAHRLTKAERQLRITPAEGMSHFQDILAILPALHADLALLPRAYQISSLTRHGVYDCLYVALAEREGCALLTADAKLINNLRSAFPFITPLASLP